MKLITVTHHNIDYEFRYLEESKVVEISKAGVFSYLMTKHPGFFRCSCPGARYHHKCWHPSMIKLLMAQPSVTEPWSQWAEEAGRMMYEGA